MTGEKSSYGMLEIMKKILGKNGETEKKLASVHRNADFLDWLVFHQQLHSVHYVEVVMYHM